jgi:hypothetical protein
MTGGASSCAALKGLPSAEQPRDRPGHAPAPDVQPQPAPAHGPVVAAAPVTVGSHVLTPPRPGPSRTGGTASRTGASRSTAALARQRATEASARSAGGTSGLYRAVPSARILAGHGPLQQREASLLVRPCCVHPAASAARCAYGSGSSWARSGMGAGRAAVRFSQMPSHAPRSSAWLRMADRACKGSGGTRKHGPTGNGQDDQVHVHAKMTLTVIFHRFD